MGPYNIQDLPLWPNMSPNMLVTLLVRDKVGDALQVLALLVPCVHVYKLTRQRLCSRCQSCQQRACNAPPAAQKSRSHVEATLHATANCGCLHEPQTAPSCGWVSSTQFITGSSNVRHAEDVSANSPACRGNCLLVPVPDVDEKAHLASRPPCRVPVALAAAA